MTETGLALRQIRMNLGILLYDMAREIGVGAATLSGFEHGKEELPEEARRRLVEVYGIEAERALRSEEAK